MCKLKCNTWTKLSELLIELADFLQAHVSTSDIITSARCKERNEAADRAEALGASGNHEGAAKVCILLLVQAKPRKTGLQAPWTMWCPTTQFLVVLPHETKYIIVATPYTAEMAGSIVLADQDLDSNNIGPSDELGLAARLQVTMVAATV